MCDDNINILSVYEPNIDKKKLGAKIKETLSLYKSAQSQADKDEMAAMLIAHSKTLEQALQVGYSGMQNLYDDKCDLEEKCEHLESQLAKALSIIKRENSSNPELLKELSILNVVSVPNKQGKRDYRKMVKDYVVCAKNLSQ